MNEKHLNMDFRKYQEGQRRSAEITQEARKVHRSMKRTFRGIYSYPTRKLMHKVGQNSG